MTTSPPHDLTIVRVGCPDVETARAIRDAAIGSGLARVGHMSDVRSCFLWKGEIVERDETVLEIRIELSRFDEAVTLIEGIHPYETPSIVAVPILATTPAYGEWLRGG